LAHQPATNSTGSYTPPGPGTSRSQHNRYRSPDTRQLLLQEGWHRPQEADRTCPRKPKRRLSRGRGCRRFYRGREMRPVWRQSRTRCQADLVCPGCPHGSLASVRLVAAATSPARLTIGAPPPSGTDLICPLVGGRQGARGRHCQEDRHLCRSSGTRWPHGVSTLRSKDTFACRVFRSCSLARPQACQHRRAPMERTPV
jgi:hypothetical protein